MSILKLAVKISLITDNAEKIAGDYKFDIGTYIKLHVHVGNCDEAPYISVTKDFIPERFVENIDKKENKKS